MVTLAANTLQFDRRNQDQTRPAAVVLTAAHHRDAQLAAAAVRAGAIGIVDLTLQAQLCSHDWEAASAAGDTWGVRVRRDQLELLRGHRFPFLVLASGAGRIDRARSLADTLVVEATSIDRASQAAAMGADIVLLRGNEAGGPVAPQSSFILLQHASRNLDAQYWIQGGMGPDTAAAAAIAGASGIVFCEALWLARESPLCDAERRTVASLDGTETEVLGQATLVRVFARGQRARLDTARADAGADAELVLGGSLFDGLVPMGQDVGMASSCSERFGTVGRFLSAVHTRLEDASDVARAEGVLSRGSALAQSLGLRYPVAQGPMTRVSDVPAFGKAVADEGALPFFALALMRGEAARAVLTEAQAQLGDRPWGVGVLGFVPPELRAEQMAVVRDIRPSFALIAGGRPAQAAGLEKHGIRTFLHVPTPGLLRAFIDEGARRFIFEGRECGGHVGPLSSYALWQQACDVLRALPDSKLSQVQVFFAGGVHDALSSAMVASLVAPLCKRGLQVGVLMGSAYVCTREAAVLGAVTEAFQTAILEASQTTLLSSGAGYSVRCAPSQFALEFERHKAQLQQAGIAPADVVQRLEDLNVGRLRIATKGVTRDGDELRAVDVAEQKEHGLFMVGDVATLCSESQTLAELHRNVCETYLEHLPRRERAHPRNAPSREPIAIVAMDGFFPQSPTGVDFWQNIFSEFCAIREVPVERWRQEHHFDPDRRNRDATYSKWGTFLDDIEFNPLAYGIPPTAMPSIEPIQLLALEVSARALRAAGLELETFPRDRTAVVVAASGSHDLGLRYSFRTMARHYLPQVEGLPDDVRSEIVRFLDESLPAWTEDSFPGFLMNVIAGRISNRLDLGGPNFAVDAACASSLAAVYQAAAQLRLQLCDAAVVTAVDGTNNPFGFTAFAQTHALSPDGRSRPFAADADGIVLGEGVASVVLRRLSDAERDGDHIHAVVRGIGSSSDGRYTSLTAPSPKGQRVALRRAYEEAGVEPSSVELFEAHATGTSVGDRAEVSALQGLLSDSGAAPLSAVVGSVKSMIGHTKTTAGLASLMKTAFAIEQRALPATLGVDTPNEQFRVSDSPLVVSSTTRPWTVVGDSKRRAGVSAFGFGGTNFHVVLEEYTGNAHARRLNPRSVEPFFLAAQSGSELRARVERLRADGTGKSVVELARQVLEENVAEPAVRLGLAASSRDHLHELLGQALGALDGNGLPPSSDVVLSHEEPLRTDELCFLYAGQGSQRPGMGAGLLFAHPELHDHFARLAAVADGALPKPLPNLIYPAPDFGASSERERAVALSDTRVAQPALAVVDTLVARLLAEYGVEPGFVAGHSFGELVALWGARVIDEETLVSLAVTRGAACADATHESPGTMAAVFADGGTVFGVLKNADIEVCIANLNSPKQTVIAGSRSELERARALFDEASISSRMLPVSAPFHTPTMEPARRKLAAACKKIAFARPDKALFSNHLAAPYPSEAPDIARALSQHLVSPVRFADELRALHRAGARFFVEVGPGRAQTGMVRDTLGDSAGTAVTCDGDEWRAFCRCLLQLAVAGIPVNFARAFEGRGATTTTGASDDALTWLVGPTRAVPKNATLKPAPAPIQMPNVSPAVLETPMADRTDPLLSHYQRTMDKWLDLQTQQAQTQQQFLALQQQFLSTFCGSARAATSSSLANLAGVGVSEPPASSSQREAQARRVKVAPSPIVTIEDHAGARETSAAPEPASRPLAISGAPATETFQRDLLAAVSTRTGYPESMLGLDKEIASELGIDSIKLVEIFSSLKSYHPYLSGDEGDEEANLEAFARLKTLGDIVASYDEKRSGMAAASPHNAEAARPAAIESEVAVATEPASRLVLEAKSLPVCASNDHLGRGGHIVILGDVPEVTEGVRAGLEQLGASCAVYDRPSALPSSPTVEALDLNDSDAVRSALSRRGDIQGIINLLPLGYADETPVSESALDAGIAWLNILKAFDGANGPQDQRFVVNVTAIDGSFGLKSLPDGAATQATTVGMTKAVAREWPKVQVKTLDIDPDWDSAAMVSAILEECAGGFDAIEVGVGRDGRCTLGLATCPATPSARGAVDDDAVILVTGGANGITAEVLKAFAQSARPRLIIVGRSPRPNGETEALAHLETAALRQHFIGLGVGQSPAEIERAVRSELRRRSMSDNLLSLSTLASEVEYHALDVTDDEALAALIEGIYERFGRLDGVIHGAGVIEDRHIADKDVDSFRRVLATKVSSALTISRCVRPSGLRFFVLFSSVAARAGSAGQVDYAAANEFLNKLAAQLDRKWPARVVAINWGPWEGGMIDAGLRDLYAKRGIGLVSIEEGAEHFLREVASVDGPPEVVITRSADKIVSPA